MRREIELMKVVLGEAPACLLSLGRSRIINQSIIMYKCRFREFCVMIRTPDQGYTTDCTQRLEAYGSYPPSH